VVEPDAAAATRSRRLVGLTPHVHQRRAVQAHRQELTGLHVGRAGIDENGSDGAHLKDFRTAGPSDSSLVHAQRESAEPGTTAAAPDMKRPPGGPAVVDQCEVGAQAGT
jgi:hypothetical protein